MHRFYVPAIASDRQVDLPSDEAHHLVRVLRLGPGADVIVFDGAGREWSARVTHAKGTEVSIELVEARVPVPEPAVHVTLAVALLKGDQMDAVVRDATVLGVRSIQPIVSDHVAVAGRLRQRAAAADRWRRVAIAAAKQCERAVVPVIRPVSTFDAIWQGAALAMSVICLEPAHDGGGPPDLLPPPAAAVIVVGPEGGWSPRETAFAIAHDAKGLTLGPRRLRAEAVPAVAMSSLWTIWGWT